MRLAAWDRYREPQVAAFQMRTQTRQRCVAHGPVQSALGGSSFSLAAQVDINNILKTRFGQWR